MFYRKCAVFDAHHPDKAQVSRVTTLPMQNNILEQCNRRRDSWASTVQNRLHGCIDLVAAEAVYHPKCLTWFMLNKEPDRALEFRKFHGRPEDHTACCIGLKCYVNGLNQKQIQGHTC